MHQNAEESLCLITQYTSRVSGHAANLLLFSKRTTGSQRLHFPWLYIASVSAAELSGNLGSLIDPN